MARKGRSIVLPDVTDYAVEGQNWWKLWEGWVLQGGRLNLVLGAQYAAMPIGRKQTGSAAEAKSHFGRQMGC
jgi:hypothetical protein